MNELLNDFNIECSEPLRPGSLRNLKDQLRRYNIRIMTLVARPQRKNGGRKYKYSTNDLFRPEGRRKGGKPQKKWLKDVEKNLKVMGVRK